MASGDFAKAEEMLALAARNRPDDYQAISIRGVALRKLGREAEAREASIAALAAAERRIAINPGESRALYLAAVDLMYLGQRKRAFEFAERAVAVDPNEVSTWYNVGCMYAVAGEKERAIANLKRAVEQGFAQREWVDNDSDWDSVRDDPRFEEIRARIGPLV